MSQFSDLTKGDLADVAQSRLLKARRVAPRPSSSSPTMSRLATPSYSTAGAASASSSSARCICIRQPEAVKRQYHTTSPEYREAVNRMATHSAKPTSRFFKVVLAEMEEPPARPFKFKWPLFPVNPVEEEEQRRRCYNMIDWSKGKEREDVPPEEKLQVQPVNHDNNDYSKPSEAQMKLWLFPPTGKWEWATGLNIEDAQVLSVVESCDTYDITLKRGNLGGHPIDYMCKTWKKQMQNRWEGFFTEAALYKAECYLKNYQGEIVPRVIGMFDSAGETHLAMEPPHPVFWVQASRSMPDVLKERVLQAYRDLHNAGIVHGSPDPNRVLIGADCRITITDFQHGRSVVPNERLKIKEATVGQFAREMRKVKCMLDYQGAFARELEKARRAGEVRRRNEEITKLQERRNKGEDVGEIPPLDTSIQEEGTFGPLNDADLKRWKKQMDEGPRRFVFPSVTKEQLHKECTKFMAMLVSLEAQSKEKCPVHPMDGAALAASDERPPDVQLGKRRRTNSEFESEAERAERIKRNRLEIAPSLLTPAVYDRQSWVNQKLTDVVREMACQSSPVLSTPAVKVPPARAFGVQSSYSGDYSLRNSRFRRWDEPVAQEEDEVYADYVITTFEITPRAAPIKVTDYAYKPYKGKRGYYVPHPPTQTLMETYRWSHIRGQNIEICAREGLDHGLLVKSSRRAALQELGLKRDFVARGGLRRIKEMTSVEWSRFTSRRAAKDEYRSHEQEDTLKRKWCSGNERGVHFSQEYSYHEYEVPTSSDDEMPQPEGDPNPRPRKSARIAHAEARRSPAAKAPVTNAPVKRKLPRKAPAVRKLKSALRKTPTPRLVPHNKDSWDHIDSVVEEQLSPKLGPVEDWATIKTFRLAAFSKQQRAGLPPRTKSPGPGPRTLQPQLSLLQIPIAADEIAEMELDQADLIAQRALLSNGAGASTPIVEEEDDMTWATPSWLSVRNQPHDMWQRIRERRVAEELYDKQEELVCGPPPAVPEYNNRDVSLTPNAERALENRPFDLGELDSNSDCGGILGSERLTRNRMGSMPDPVAGPSSVNLTATSRPRRGSVESVASDVSVKSGHQGRKSGSRSVKETQRRSRKSHIKGQYPKSSRAPSPSLSEEEEEVEGMVICEDEPERSPSTQSSHSSGWFVPLRRWF